MEIMRLIVLSMIGEAVWETLKMTWQHGKVSIDRVGAMLVGLLLALITGADILTMVGIPVKVPYIGIVLTGILISRGANFMHDLLSGINTMSQSNRPK